MTIPVIIAFAGALLSALAAIWSSINQAEESDKNSKLNERLAAKSDEIAEYAKKQEKASDENKKLNQQLAAKSDTIADFAQEQVKKLQELQRKQDDLDKKAAIQDQKTDVINQQTKELANLSLQLVDAQQELKKFTSESLNYLTGGDSWCYLTFSQNGNELNVRLHHKGTYPLIALRVSIQHTSEMLRASKGMGAMQKGFIMAGTYATEIPVGTVPKTHTRYYPGLLIGTVPYKPNENESYRVFFYAQNGEWYQDQTYTYNDKRVITASTKVMRDGKELLSY